MIRFVLGVLAAFLITLLLADVVKACDPCRRIVTPPATLLLPAQTNCGCQPQAQLLVPASATVTGQYGNALQLQGTGYSHQVAQFVPVQTQFVPVQTHFAPAHAYGQRFSGGGFGGGGFGGGGSPLGGLGSLIADAAPLAGAFIGNANGGPGGAVIGAEAGRLAGSLLGGGNVGGLGFGGGRGFRR